MFGPEFMDYTLPYIIIGLFVLAIIYFIYAGRQLKMDSMRIGRELGFLPYPGEKGYPMRTEREGMDVFLSILQDIGNRGAPPYFKVDVRCLIPNTPCKSLFIYPESAMDLGRPVAFLPPEIKEVGHWDWYTVRGEPADITARVLPDCRKTGGEIFQDKYGFRLLELSNCVLDCHFSLTGRPVPAQVGELVNGAIALAACLNNI